MLYPVGLWMSNLKPKGGTSWKFLKFQKSGSIITIPIRKKNTVRAYRWVIKRLCNDFGGEELSEISPDKILQFFNTITEGCRPRTKRVRFAHLSSFFNFLKNNRDPKSGKEQEVVFIPQKVADRLREYARQNCKNPNDRIFPISYEAARIMVLKAGNMAGIYLHHMIYAGMLRHMHQEPEFLLKLLVKLSSGTRIQQQQSHSTASHQNFDNKTFRIIHPFHPYRNIEFEIDSVRRIAHERRVFFFNTKGRRSSVPLHWTDIGPKDPFVAVSAGRSFFRVADLLGLVRLIEEINSANRKWASRMVRWIVKKIMPQKLNNICRIYWMKWRT